MLLLEIIHLEIAWDNYSEMARMEKLESAHSFRLIFSKITVLSKNASFLYPLKPGHSIGGRAIVSPADEKSGSVYPL